MEKKKKIDDMEIRAESRSKSGRLLGYCAEHEGVKGIALLDGKQECLGFISMESLQNKIESSPFIVV